MDIGQDYKSNEDPSVNQKIAGFVLEFFGPEEEGYLQVNDHVWRFTEEDYEINLIITSKLIVFDAELSGLPTKLQAEFVLELLKLNGHQTKACKFCMVKGMVRLRIVYEHEYFVFEAFKSNMEEMRWQFPRFRESLGQKFFA
ncbi:MAG: hypothetical protein QNL04_00265 [SAR324 cluster bacterium]|nr:hypothetical protein [SAR324 cluster bacterium]